jgi:hypothetical protein
MTGHTQIGASAHERFMHLARKELASFERRERQFRADERKERAEKLRFSVEKAEREEPPH